MTPAWNWAQSIRATERNLQSNWSKTSFLVPWLGSTGGPRPSLAQSRFSQDEGSRLRRALGASLVVPPWRKSSPRAADVQPIDPSITGERHRRLCNLSARQP